MQIDGKIASVYAQALFELIPEKKDLLDTEQELNDIVAALGQDSQVWAYLASPITDPDEKVSLLDRALQGRISDLLIHFLKTMAWRRRMNALPEIVVSFSSQVDEKIGRKHATIKSARKLSDEDLQGVKATLTKYFNKEIIIKEETRPELIGGLVIDTGDIVIDTSISRKLKQMNKLMKEHKIFGETYYEN